VKFTDPAVLTPSERLAEIAELLAVGVQRLLARQCKPNKGRKISQERLDVNGAIEASCGSPMESPA
jgi:hypothetical protein